MTLPIDVPNVTFCVAKGNVWEGESIPFGGQKLCFCLDVADILCWRLVEDVAEGADEVGIIGESALLGHEVEALLRMETQHTFGLGHLDALDVLHGCHACERGEFAVELAVAHVHFLCHGVHIGRLVGVEQQVDAVGEAVDEAQVERAVGWRGLAGG